MPLAWLRCKIISRLEHCPGVQIIVVKSVKLAFQKRQVHADEGSVTRFQDRAGQAQLCNTNLVSGAHHHVPAPTDCQAHREQQDPE